jgi:hypothetical protein
MLLRFLFAASAWAFAVSAAQPADLFIKSVVRPTSALDIPPSPIISTPAISDARINIAQGTPINLAWIASTPYTKGTNWMLQVVVNDKTSTVNNTDFVAAPMSTSVVTQGGATTFLLNSLGDVDINVLLCDKSFACTKSVKGLKYKIYPPNKLALSANTSPIGTAYSNNYPLDIAWELQTASPGAALFPIDHLDVYVDGKKIAKSIPRSDFILKKSDQTNKLEYFYGITNNIKSLLPEGNHTLNVSACMSNGQCDPSATASINLSILNPKLSIGNPSPNINSPLSFYMSTFDPHAHLMGDWNHTLFVGDFNGDKKSDFLNMKKVLKNDDLNVLTGIQTYINNGVNYFNRFTDFGGYESSMPANSAKIYLADFDGDGKTDFLRHQIGKSNGEIFYSNGKGGFTPVLIKNSDGANALNADLASIIVGDFNGDGKADFIRQEKGVWANDNVNMIQLFINRGNAEFSRFELKQEAIFNGNLTNLYAGDFNGDGKTDFIRQEKGAWANDDINMAHVFFSKGDGTFTEARDLLPSPWNVNGNKKKLVMGDFNGDGKTDFILQPLNSNEFAYIYFSLGDGSFKVAPFPSTNMDLSSNKCTLVVGDFNGDHIMDIARQEIGTLAADFTNNLQIFLSKGDGTFVLKQEGDKSLQASFVTSFNGNPYPYNTTIFNQWSTATGGQLFNAAFSVWAPDNYIKLEVGDFDGDGITDIMRRTGGVWTEQDRSVIFYSKKP